MCIWWTIETTNSETQCFFNCHIPHIYIAGTIRPAKVFDATNYLVSTDLYRNITYINGTSELINNFNNQEEIIFLLQTIMKKLWELWKKQENNINPSGTETLLDSEHVKLYWQDVLQNLQAKEGNHGT